MIRLAGGLCLVLCAAAECGPPCRAGVESAAAAEPSVSVRAVGRLRHGVMALGGETTGTTLSAGGVTWEVRLAEADRERAAALHKKTVVAAGRLRRLVAVETGVRWIIDAETLESPEKPPEPGTEMTVVGTVRGGSVEADGQTWPVELPPGADAPAGLIRLTGRLRPADEKDAATPGPIEVETLVSEPAPQ